MSTANNDDTIKLLRECDAGIKMGIASLEDVISSSNDYDLEQRLKQSKTEHEQLRTETEIQLNQFHDKGKQPNPAAKAMSHVKTKLVTSVDKSDRAVARLITKGCEMGVNSLNNYLEKYAAANMSSRDLANKVIASEKQLASYLKQYL